MNSEQPNQSSGSRHHDPQAAVSARDTGKGKEAEGKFAKRAYILVLLATALAMVSAAAAPWYRIATGGQASEASSFIGAIIAAVALTIASAIFLPELRLRSIAEEHAQLLESRLNKQLADLAASQTNRLAGLEASQTKQITEVDAHLSRVVGKLLTKHEPIWGFGWLLRATHRYLRLPVADQRKYADLLEMISREVERCVEHIRAGVRSGDGIAQVAEKVGEAIGLGPRVAAQQNEEEKEEKRRIVVRLLKDFFELSRLYDSGHASGSIALDAFRPILRAATPAAYVLALTLEQLGYAPSLAEELRAIGSSTAYYVNSVEPALTRVKAKLSTLLGHFIDNNEDNIGLGVHYLDP